MKHSYITIQNDGLAEAVRVFCLRNRMTLSEFYAKAAELLLSVPNATSAEKGRAK